VRRFATVGGGTIIDTNAVDRYGRVLGHSGPHVLDGARIPGSTGVCNPTIVHTLLHGIGTDTARL
jgi:cholesterol oxidase